MYHAPDESDSTKMAISEEELKVEEEWVRSKFAELDIQHIINMHQTDKWTDVPRNAEVRIAKHTIVCVRYVPPQVRHVLDYDAMAKAINEKEVTISKRRKKLGFADFPPERLEKLTLLEQTIPRRGRDSKHSMPSKVSRKPNSDDVYDKQLEKKRLEREEAKWEK